MDKKNRFEDLPKVLFARIQAKKDKEGMERWINKEALNPAVYRAVEELSIDLNEPESSVYKVFYVNWIPKPEKIKMAKDSLGILAPYESEEDDLPSIDHLYRTFGPGGISIIEFVIHGHKFDMRWYIGKKIFKIVSDFIGWHMHQPPCLRIFNLGFEIIHSRAEFSCAFTPPPDKECGFQMLIWEIIDAISFLTFYGSQWERAIKDISSEKEKDMQSSRDSSKEAERADRWSDISIEMLGPEVDFLKLSIKGGKLEKITQEQVGMKNSRKSTVNFSWLLLYEKAVENSGLPLLQKDPKPKQSTIRKREEALCKKLKKYFTNIPGLPLKAGKPQFHIKLSNDTVGEVVSVWKDHTQTAD